MNYARYRLAVLVALCDRNLLNDYAEPLPEALFEQSETEWTYVGPDVLNLEGADLEVNESGTLVRHQSRHVEASEMIWQRFRFHFQPRDATSHRAWRVELNRTRDSLHANTDHPPRHPRHRLEPTQLTLRIDDFNVLLALEVAERYLATREYPVDQRYGGKYNAALETVRRQNS